MSNTNVLTVPDDFRATALAFPAAVKMAIASIDNAGEAGGNLAKAETLAGYAKRIHATTEEVNSVQYGKLLLAAKVGELSPAGKRGPKTEEDNHPAGEKLFHANTLTSYRKLYKYQAEGRQIDSYWIAIEGAGHEQEMSIAGFLQFVGAGGNLKSNQNRGVIEWYTPAEYIEAARKTMGSIDLDPASNDMANEIVKADVYYTQDDDGLDREWEGNVFMNPPFKASLISKFGGKLCRHHETGEVPQAVLLTNNNTDTKWWHQAAEACRAICFTAGRVSFYSPAGEIASPTNGHTFFYFGDSVERFVEAFGGYGRVMVDREEASAA